MQGDLTTPMRPQGSIEPELTPPVTPPDKLDVLEVPLGLTDYDGALDWIDDMVQARQQGYVCVCNVHTVMASAEDPQLRSALLGSSLNVPDGQPLVWSLNLLGHSLDDRVYGPELMARSCARAMESGQRMYLYGGRNQGALVQLALNLRPRSPRRRVRGGH